MEIVDCFPYFNEKELLELRINLMHDYVDRFIITDADHTHKGDPKPFTCKETLKELGLVSDKIQVIEVNLPSNKRFKSAWIRERMQRDEAAKYFNDDTIAYVSDCDEIINPEYIEYYLDMIQKIPYDIYRVPLMNLQGRGDFQVYHQNGNPEEWNVPFFCIKRHFQEHTLSYIRENMFNPLCNKEQASYKHNHQNFANAFLTINGEYLQYAGWHFTWMGDLFNRTQKLNSFLHWDEFDKVQNPEENTTDVLGREGFTLKKISHNLLPQKIFELPRVKEYLLPEYKVSHIYQNPEFGEDWFSYPNLYSSMVNQFPSGSKFIEVGSWKGKSSAFMAAEIANSQKDIEFICIDTWEGSVEHQDFKELKNLYDIFKSNMKPLEKYYRSIKSKSLDAVNLFPDQSLDFVFIDASHEYEDVKNDINAWFPKVKVGGVLAGHDYYENNDYAPGVKMAVNEIFRDFRVSENCFIVRKK
jgi:hypothetical protein